MPRHRRGWAMDEGSNRGNRHSPLTFSLLEPALLIMIKEQPRHGYTLLADLNAMGMNTLHPSVVYRTLREMEALHWIDSDWETNQTQGPPRRIYQITATGKEALQNWQQELGKSLTLIGALLKKIEDS